MFTEAELSQSLPDKGFILQYQTREGSWHDLFDAGSFKTLYQAAMAALSRIAKKKITFVVGGHTRNILIDAADLCIIDRETGELYRFVQQEYVIKLMYPDESLVDIGYIRPSRESSDTPVASASAPKSCTVSVVKSLHL